MTGQWAHANITIRMDANDVKSTSHEGPFTILSGVTGLSAIALSAVALMIPTARFVIGGLLLGIAIGVVGTWLMWIRHRRHQRPTKQLALAAVVTAACGIFLLTAPTYLALPQLQSPSSPHQTGPPYLSPSPSDSVRFQGPVRVVAGVWKDLEHLPALAEPGNQDIYMGFSEMTVQADGRPLGLWTDVRPPSRQECVRRLATSGQPKVPVVPGAQLSFCLRTSNGMYAFLKALSVQSKMIDFDVTLWGEP
jgi:hypothetical protein